MATESSAGVQKRKPRGKPFPKGRSGNPGGRHKGTAEVRKLARDYTNLAITTLASICRKADRDTARVAAASALLDRGYGKPSTEIDIHLTLQKMLEGMSTEQLERVASAAEVDE